MTTLTKSALVALNRREKKNAEKIVVQFCKALEAWDSIAQPIQLIYQGEGSIDQETEKAFKIARGFTLSLNNEHREVELAARVVDTQRKVFKEAGRLDEWLKRDEEIFAKNQSHRKERASARGRTPSIQPYYAQTIERTRNTAIEVTDERIRLGRRAVHPDQVTGLRWGRKVSSLGSNNDIWIASGNNVLHISNERADVYKNIVYRLLRGCGARIACELRNKLQRGECEMIGDLSISENGAHLTKHRLLRANITQWVPWHDTLMQTVGEEVVIRKIEDWNVRGRFSPREDWNGVLWQFMLTVRQKSGRSTLPGI